MTAYRELIERLEKATGPDFQLDCEIAWIFGQEPWAGRPHEHIGMCMPGSKNAKATAPVTSSIDAALTLVEKMLPGWKVASYGADHAADFEANIEPKSQPYPAEFDIWATSKSRPVSILIALLRALEAQSKDKGEGE